MIEGERIAFIGPNPGALIHVRLDLWREFYDSLPRFPYPSPRSKCYAVGKFVEFRIEKNVAYWRLSFEAFPTMKKFWVREAFFNGDNWRYTSPESYLEITRELYEEHEVAAIAERDASSEEDSSDGDNEPPKDQGPGDLPITGGRGRPRGRQKNTTPSNNRSQMQQRRQDSDTDSNASREPSDDGSTDGHGDLMGQQRNIEFKAPGDAHRLNSMFLCCPIRSLYHYLNTGLDS